MRPTPVSIERITGSHLRAVRIFAAASCLVLASAACSDRDAGQEAGQEDGQEDGQDESAAMPSGGDPRPEQQAAADEPATVVGSMSIDGRSYDLVRSFRCEPGSGVEGGTELAIKVGAFHDDGRLIHVMATQVDRDRDRASVQQVSATEPGTGSYYQSGTVMLSGSTAPVLTVEDGHVRIQGDVQSGGNIVPLDVEFALPEEFGGPFGAC